MQRLLVIILECPVNFLQVCWAPFHETVLGSCGEDRRVHLWDLSRIGVSIARAFLFYD